MPSATLAEPLSQAINFSASDLLYDLLVTAKVN